MKRKKMTSKLTNIAVLLLKDDFVLCDITISAHCIRLSNWSCHMIPMVVLKNLMHLCDKFGLLYFVDFDDNEFYIYG